jgi:ATP-dependent RNA helicase SUPV3L1/SUV3
MARDRQQPPGGDGAGGRGIGNTVVEGTMGPREALLAAAAERPDVGGETRDGVEAAVERMAELLETLPEPDRQQHLADALDRIPLASASLRKLEKRIRQAALRRASGARVDAVIALAPEIRIDDLRGTVRFSQATELDVRIDGAPHRVPVVARILGGPLEQTLLTQPPEVFVAEAREALAQELDAARSATRHAARAIEQILQDRVHRPLYNAKSLRRAVARSIRDAVDLEDALERIRYDIAPLDREAQERERVRAMVAEHGLIAYRDYFPRARSMRRELVLYAGPTNSGKTWRALNELTEAESGAYLAPLRLLALEGQEEIEKRGRTASFITGEERDIREEATFVASTIEMMDTQHLVDVVVIDEVQLLTDPDRGWAWCQALVGAPARRVIMTGSPDCIPLVEAMAAYLGEPLTIERLQRHTPIEAESAPLSLQHIAPGTAVIAFSRRDVLAIKAELESRFRVAVIYGNLTPEVRREEARRFRSGEAQVVVSTDAIAMGLNLPIETVVFSTLEKWNGRDYVQLEPWEILQIGGRAGRFGHYERGHVGALDRRDAQRVARVFAPDYTPPEREVATSVRPGSEHIAVIAEGLRTPRLSRALAAFQRGMTFDSHLLSPGVHDDMIALAEVADRYHSIPLADRLTLACAPVDTRLTWLMHEYESWIDALAADDAVDIGPLRIGFAKERASDDEELKSAEMEAKRLTLYSWLAYRYPESFPDIEECGQQRMALDRFIERSLAVRAGKRGVCRVCGEPLPRRWRGNRCAQCQRGQPGGGRRRGRQR